MKAFYFLKKNFWICLLILLAIGPIIIPIIFFFICAVAILLPPGAFFSWYYKDARLEAKDVVGTWVRDCDSNDATTLRFNEDNTVKWSQTLERQEEEEYDDSYPNRCSWGLVGLCQLEFTGDSRNGSRWEEEREVDKIVQKWLKDGVNVFVGTYEIVYSDGKIKWIEVDWREINGASVPDVKIKLTTTLNAQYEASERRNVLLWWDHEDADSGCRPFYKAP